MHILNIFYYICQSKFKTQSFYNMENHRLKPMKEGYSQELFNKLYKEVKPLIRKLTYEIDHRRFGVSRDIIESWFDDKLLFVFNKHCQEFDEGHLKGAIINSLKTFKLRVLRDAYTKRGEFYSSSVDLESSNTLVYYIQDKNDLDTNDIFMGMVSEFMKKQLSDDAYMLLSLQLNPPPFILNQIPRSNSNIPINLILEFFDLDNISKNVKWIRTLRKEIDQAIEKAKLEFNPV